MTGIYLTLNNFNDFEFLKEIFPKSDEYEFTAEKVFRRKAAIKCECGTFMVHNGYDYVRKSGFGKARVGKQCCHACGEQHHEDKGFWKNLLAQWKELTIGLICILRDSNVAWEKISQIFNYIIPSSKGKTMYLFNECIEKFEYNQEDYLIVNYDEQHPKMGRMQKFRLTILNYKTRIPIAEELFDSKDEQTIENFLRKYLDPKKKIVVIVDCDRRYPAILKRIFGNNVVIQKCLLHLNKLVVRDFGKNITLVNEYNKYLILNIFYDRTKELEFLEILLKELDKKTFADAKEKNIWIKEAKNKFYEYIKKLENERRSKKENLIQRPLEEAIKKLEKLLSQKALFHKKVQDRLKMIEKNWKYFTAFYNIEGCPATNNAIENYYSTSLKTHRKKQLRTDKGIIFHMKLSAMKRKEGFCKPKKTFLEIFKMIALIKS